MNEQLRERLTTWLANAKENKRNAMDDMQKLYYQGCIDTLTDTLNLF